MQHQQQFKRRPLLSTKAPDDAAAAAAAVFLPRLRPLPLLLGVSLHGRSRIPRMFQILHRASAERETQQCAPDAFEVPTQTFLSGGRTRLNTHRGMSEGLKVRFGTLTVVLQ